MKRGEIVFVQNDCRKHTGSEQTYSRPAVIVSNNKCNENSPVVEVVFLTTAKKKFLPTHVLIHSTKYTSVALCEEIFSVDKSRIEESLGYVSLKEMLQINTGIAIGLGLI